jgi:hypothetical protein
MGLVFEYLEHFLAGWLHRDGRREASGHVALVNIGPGLLTSDSLSWLFPTLSQRNAYAYTF